MAENLERLITDIKHRAEMFLMDAAEFFPFGSYINKNDDIIPCHAYIEHPDDRPESLPLIDMLEGFFIDRLEKGEIVIGAIAIDVSIKEGDVTYDGIQIRFYENEKQFIQTLKYTIGSTSVDFY